MFIAKIEYHIYSFWLKLICWQVKKTKQNNGDISPTGQKTTTGQKTFLLSLKQGTWIVSLSLFLSKCTNLHKMKLNVLFWNHRTKLNYSTNLSSKFPTSVTSWNFVLVEFVLVEVVLTRTFLLSLKHGTWIVSLSLFLSICTNLHTMKLHMCCLWIWIPRSKQSYNCMTIKWFWCNCFPFASF